MSLEQRQHLRQVRSTPEARKRRSEINRALWQDPEVRKRRIESMNLTWADPKVRERMSAAGKLRWADPEVRKRRIERMELALADPKVRKRISAASKSSWADPEVRKRRIESIKLTLAKPKAQERMSERSKQMWANLNPAQHQARVEKTARTVRAAWAGAWRPDDWWDEDKADWRIIGNELLSQLDFMPSDELGRRLDAAKLLRCPENYGDCWETALARNSSARNLASKIRTWVRRSKETLKAATVV